MKNSLLVLAVAVVLTAAGRAPAQAEPPHVAKIRFAQELRARGYGDLALEYLAKIQSDPSPELQKLLPLDVARTELDQAGHEPDLAKRLEMYGRARAGFANVLKASPG